MQEVTYPLWNSTLLSVFFLLAAAATYSFHLKHQLKKRISVLRSRTPEEIPSDKIIIAIQPNQLFFKLAATHHPGYREVIYRDETDFGIFGGLARLFRKKIYYRLTHQKTEILSFLQSLAHNNKIQLYLYTRVSLQVAEFVFKQLGTLKYFPENFRVSCSENSKMHAVQVDSQTNRVIICTGSKKDIQEEYSKYFLVMRKSDKNLGKTGRKLNKLVNINEDIDDLHNQLTLLKLKVESESEGCGQAY